MQKKLFTFGTLLLITQANAGVFTLPAPSEHRINMAGDSTTAPDQGVAGYLRWAGGVDRGHDLGGAVVQNSPNGSRAYYYLSGIERTPSPSGSTDTARGTSFLGMPATASYFNDNGGDLSSLTLRFGQSVGDMTRAWNLGGDVNGVDWFGGPASNVEERIYTANPGDVEIGLYYSGTRVLTFDYTDLYMVLDYGATTEQDDDAIAAFSDAVPANKSAGLAGFEDGLADALLADIAAAGGLVQLNFDSIQPATRVDYGDASFNYGAFEFQGSLQVIPEPSEYAMAFGLVALASGLYLRRRRTQSAAE